MLFKYNDLRPVDGRISCVSISQSRKFAVQSMWGGMDIVVDPKFPSRNQDIFVFKITAFELMFAQFGFRSRNRGLLGSRI